jgi:DNA polymerase-3 subunit gamma/tau
VLDLFEAVMRGDAAGALRELSAQYSEGADPLAVLRDLAEITHWISVVKVTPEAAEDPTTPPAERDRGRDLAARLPMRALSRMWQMLLRALDEVGQAPNAMMAAEMAVIRLTHVADLPDPATLVRRLSQTSGPPAGAMSAPGGALGPGPVARAVGEVRMAPAPQPDTGAVAHLRTFDHLVELIRESRDMTLLFDVENHVRPVVYAPGRLEFQPTPDAPRELAQRLAHRLMGLTGVRWGVSVVAAGGGPTLAEARDTDWQRRKAEAEAEPLVQAVFAAFPGAKVVEVRDPAAQAADAALAPVDDEWDPFETD